MTDEVIYKRHSGWAEIILNRPATRNAINGPLGILLAQYAQAATADDSINAVLLRGAGGAFCSGLDLNQFNADPAPDWLEAFPLIWRSAHKALFELRPALVVALERYAINGGAALALAGDLLVMGDESFLHVGEVQQGMGAPYNLAWLRLRHSEAVTARVALLGQRLQSSEVVSLGLAYASVPDDQLLAHAQALTAKIAAYPNGALAHVKRINRCYSAVARGSVAEGSATDESGADAWFDRAFAFGPGPSQRPRAND